MDGMKSASLALAIGLALASQPASASVCTPGPHVDALLFETSLGDFEIELCSVDAPITAGNLLGYVFSGAYTSTGFVHRSVPDFVIQGGGFFVGEGPSIQAVAARPPIPLELAGLSNLRGTVAMARTPELDSATSQWFVNLVDNLSLDTAGGGYAVFAEVVSGMQTVDLIAAQGVWNAGPPFEQLPLIDYPGSGNALDSLVYVTDVRYVPEPSAASQLALGVVAIVGLAGLRRRRSR